MTRVVCGLLNTHHPPSNRIWIDSIHRLLKSIRAQYIIYRFGRKLYYDAVIHFSGDYFPLLCPFLFDLVIYLPLLCGTLRVHESCLYRYTKISYYLIRSDILIVVFYSIMLNGQGMSMYSIVYGY